MTKAVLFQKSGQPVLFTDYAEYDTGTGYVVKDKGLKEVSVMVVTDKYKSIADAEKHYPKLLGGNNYDD